MVVFVSRQLNHFLDRVTVFKQPVLNALEQRRFTLPRPAFTGGFKGEKTHAIRLKKSLTGREENVDLAGLSHVLKEPRNPRGQENSPRIVATGITENRDQTRTVLGHEGQISQASGRQIDAHQSPTEPVSITAEVVVEMADRSPMTCTEVEHGLALFRQEVGRVAFGPQHAST